MDGPWRVFADLHTHTTYSHGRGRVADNLRAARDRGLAYLGIADHGPAHFRIGISGPEVFARIRADGRAAGFPVGWPEDAAGDGAGLPRLLVGVEANVTGLDGSIDVADQDLPRLDFLLVGLHRLVRPRGRRDALVLFLPNLLPRGLQTRAARLRARNTEALIRAVERYPVDAVTHPGLHMPIDTRALARACARLGTALEINVSHGFLSPAYVEVAAAEGARFLISSDAHDPGRVGRLEAGLQVARQAGLRLEQLVNVAPEGEPEPPLRLRGRSGRPRSTAVVTVKERT